MCSWSETLTPPKKRKQDFHLDGIIGVGRESPLSQRTTKPSQGVARTLPVAAEPGVVTTARGNTRQGFDSSVMVTEPWSVREDTIEIVRRSVSTCALTALESPLDLTIYNPGGRFTRSPPDQSHPIDDRTSPRSGNNPFHQFDARGSGYPFQVNAVGKDLTEKEVPAVQLPLFVNQENARLDAMNSLQFQFPPLGEGNCLSQEGYEPPWHSKPQGMVEGATRNSSWSDMEVPRRSKNAIDQLRAHLERRQETYVGKGGRSGAEESMFYLEKFPHEEVTLPPGRRGELETMQSSSLKYYSGLVTTQQGKHRAGPEIYSQHKDSMYTDLQSQGRICRVGNQSAANESFRLDESLASIQRLLSDFPRVPERETVPAVRPASVAGHNHHLLYSTSPVSRQQVSNDLTFSPGAIAVQSGQQHAGKHQPDSSDSRSKQELGTRSSSSEQETTHGSASPETGSLPEAEVGNQSDSNSKVPSSEVRKTKGVDHGTPEACSPDQSTDSIACKLDNLPNIIASTRLNDDCDFTSSSVEMHEDMPAEKQTEALPNLSFRSRRGSILMRLQRDISAGVMSGSGKGSSPEAPSSTFDDETDAKISEESAKTTESAIPCRICQDVANGFHYGVWSCEGCKAFFKRSITSSARYVCPADNNCTINRLRKKSCQACRLRKCYEFGMSPGNCRGENGAKVGRKRKMTEASVDKRERHDSSKQSCFAEWVGQTRLGSCSANSDDNAGLTQSRKQPTVIDTHHRTSSESDCFHIVPSILRHLMAVERPIRYADHEDRPGAGSTLKLMASIMKLVNAQLVDIVTWSLNLPGFRDLTLNVRTHLLVSSWTEVLLFTCVFQSLQSPNVYVMAPNLHLSRERCEAIGITALYNRLMPIVKSFHDLELTHKEMLLMQAIILINGSDFMVTRPFPQIDELRLELMRAWFQSRDVHGRHDGVPSSAHYDRFSRMLLLLPHIKHCSLLFLRIISDISQDTRVARYSLIQEMVTTRNELDRICVLERLDDDHL